MNDSAKVKQARLCKDCVHRRSSDGWCKAKEKHIPRKTDMTGKITVCEKWSQKGKK